MGVTLRLASSAAVDRHGFVFTLPELTGMGSVYKSGPKQQFHTWLISKRSDLEMLLPRLVKHMVIKAKHWQWQFDTLREKRGQLLTPAQCDEIRQASKISRTTQSGPLKPKNHPTWAWLAGYLDGDGTYLLKCYTTHAGYNQWHVSMSAVAHANDAAVLHFLQRTLGGVVRNHSNPGVLVWRRNMGREQSNYAVRTLPYLAKHSRLKKHKIEQMIHHSRQQRLSASTPAGETIV